MTIEFNPQNWKDYELLDSGRGAKLERFGEYVLARPEPKALWDKSMTDEEWNRLAHTRFTPGAGFGKAGKEDSGTWERLRNMPDQWWIRYNRGPKFSLRLGLTSFKHVGVFPEQAANWDYIFKHTSDIAAKTGSKPKVLNLFAYTGAASLAAKCAGADVTHLDSVRQVVTWAHGNQDRSGLDGIRWVVEDAMKFANREAKRGNLYQGVILDPPAYGHGPDGGKMETGRMSFRYDEDRRKDSRATEQFPGSEPLLERILGHSRRDGRASGLRACAGRRSRIRRACTQGQVREEPAAQYIRKTQEVERL